MKRAVAEPAPLKPVVLSPTPLSKASLPDLPPNVAVPNYVGKLTPGILHIGVVANFHRSHQCRYLHDLFQTGRDHDWGLVGATLRPSGLRTFDTWNKQDLLYTLVEQSATAATATVLGPIAEYVRPTDSAAVLRRLLDPAVRIVSLTVTEGGYYLSDSGDFDAAHPDMQADAARHCAKKAVDDDPPQTAFGLIVNALERRRAAGAPPFTVLSCDNVAQNGDVAKRATVGLAALCSASLADWIASEVAFPNTMVDRITPRTGPREKAMVREDFGVADDLPVVSETFRQWIVEDRFPAGRPALEHVGVDFVDDVAPFERMKIRILNGGHATLAYPAALLGLAFAHDALADARVKPFLLKVEREDIVPVVGAVPGTDLHKYLDVIIERFSNPKVGDTIPRLCMDGSDRQPKFIVDSIKDNLAAGRVPEGLALVSALWCRYAYGEMEDGSPIDGNDPRWASLQKAAKAARDQPRKWLEQTQIYDTVGQSEEFVTAFDKWLKRVWSMGTEACLEAYVNGEKGV